MNNIIPFDFDGQTVRTIIEDGAPLFVGRDVASALGYRDPNDAMKSHCRGPAESRSILDSLGRAQQVRVITESDVYRLIVKSTLPEAERFERWLFEDVLPSIRRTGSYTAPSAPAPQLSDKVQALLAIGEAMKLIPGVNPSIAMAATLNCITVNTGLSTEQYRQALPSPEKISAYNATELGKLISVSAREMNLLLERAGFQFRNKSGEWQMTDEGSKYGEAVPFSKNGHSSYQPKWHESVIAALKDGGHLE